LKGQLGDHNELLRLKRRQRKIGIKNGGPAIDDFPETIRQLGGCSAIFMGEIWEIFVLKQQQVFLASRF
jgi:hypothetical protein